MRREIRKKLIYLLVLLLFSYVFIFLNLGSYSLKEPDEGRYAEIPREMVEGGNYLVPHLNYVRYFEKPPLLYWVSAASFKIFGINEWSFRFPNALAGLACVLITFFFASRRFGDEAGFLSSFILLSSFGFFAITHIVTTDLLFTVFLSAALFCFYEFYLGSRRIFLNLFYAALALAILTKGPVALVLMAGTLLIFLLSERKLWFVKTMVTGDGILLFLLISSPWFVFMSLREKEFFPFFFVDQHLMRFLTTKHHRSGPLYYFIPVLAGGLLPWSIFLPRAIARFWKAGDMRLLLLWSAVVFVFFSLSGSKLPPYILPVLPALSIILGRFLTSAGGRMPGWGWERWTYVLFFFCLAFFSLLAVFPGPLDAYAQDLPGLGLFREGFRGFSSLLSALSLLLMVCFSLNMVRTVRLCLVALAAFSLSVALGLMLNVAALDGYQTTKQLSAVIKRVEPEGRRVFNLYSFDETLPFYLGQRIHFVGEKGELKMGSKYPDARGYFLSLDGFIPIFGSDERVLLVFNEKRLGRMREIFGPGLAVVTCLDRRCLAANHPVRLNP